MYHGWLLHPQKIARGGPCDVVCFNKMHQGVRYDEPELSSDFGWCMVQWMDVFIQSALWLIAFKLFTTGVCTGEES